MSETVNQETTGTNEQKTFTQDEMNAIINDRLKREREKYTDYNDLKKKAELYDKYEEASKSEIQKATERADKLQKELDEIKQAEEIRGIREKVSNETGVPVNLLTCTTEEDCKAQAEAIKIYATPTYPNVRDGGEPGVTPGVSTAQQFADWLNSM